jgi:hypothetical protein
MRVAQACCAVAAWVAASAHALPLAHAEIAKLCGEAEGPAHCGRLVEAEQLKRLPGLAARDGDTLRLALFPSGSVRFTDVDTPGGGSSYALWDYINEINAAVLWTTKDDDTGFLLVQRTTGRQTPLPAEPVLAPDRQRIATADFCPTRCENKLVVWRVSRDGVSRELEWRSNEPWTDATVRWKNADTVVVEYTRDGASEAQTLERKLLDPGWSRLQAGR